MSERTVTVSQLTNYLKNLLLQDHNLKNVLVRGEISNFKHHSSGHMYFTLKDEGASLRCVMFRNRNWNLDFSPQDGMDVIVQGVVGIFERAGLYQLYVEKMYSHGLGSLHLAFEQLKEKLAEEGIFNEEYKKTLPPFPKKIAVVTSPTGAAVRDMIVTISRRFPLTSILLIPVRVQGEYAASEIRAGIDYANSIDDIDVILVGRGGGSLEEIWPFNTEEVARAIFSSKAPVISCVGHETDFTISDFVSDLRAPTPTAAAELVVPDQVELKRQVSDYKHRLTKALYHKYRNLDQRVVELLDRPVMKNPYTLISERKKELEYLDQRLLREVYHLFKLKRNKYSSLVEQLDSLSPLKTLGRGYTFCQTHDGDIVRSVTDIEQEDILKLTFFDGSAKCLVKEKQEHHISEDHSNLNSLCNEEEDYDRQ
ncbi:exodeoxyribonuclease VII large subunit [Natranaerobius thermophilus]|uniref:Exodeoxyribonuclease 7 large subunit n=1 Tax=Natranaerobius thermophilus (strain ATCC BAA-1301 / DSM 18059 / JW/NM-WN-LF) TaxID=457570 RepID=EX7L_NATTJ|nr:exodeoxyribonuclease VII large subunit [Natranaerobius thermophilus]B2A531.1 RecName: Full=Exodeoxyribonuclease 7 large subunit; AltName: Full=Exodeoxyribonuclease VII large subunit; Short=Exonuclease VII large subunit [Natranaerobius thermophilus JW/NM-WN-LF]ACB85273.1 exodeoxyribonuclease VII, large subunit [Natranaerobius thermophilus JW/NM-WN-LF]